MTSYVTIRRVGWQWLFIKPTAKRTMHDLIESAKTTLNDIQGKKQLPFSVYSSIKEQRILNAPITKPLLILVLAGVKQLGKDNEIVCSSGTFLFLSNSPTIDMRNIPDDNDEYCAILIDFEYSDFNQFKQLDQLSQPAQSTPARRNQGNKFFQGEIDMLLKKTLQQYIEWSAFAPPAAWHFRKQELLQLLYQSGHEEVSNIAEHPSLSHQLHNIISDDISGDWGVDRLAAKLAISESTLRRKLIAEGNNILDIMNRTKLGHALHLVQTTMEPIGRIADRCGYQSQSRFTNKFKQQFGITPTELRKTRMHD
ncbi:MAG: hypothetical protein RL748_1463 [Pseudomonadota bacterium]